MRRRQFTHAKETGEESERLGRNPEVKNLSKERFSRIFISAKNNNIIPWGTFLFNMFILKPKEVSLINEVLVNLKILGYKND